MVQDWDEESRWGVVWTRAVVGVFENPWLRPEEDSPSGASKNEDAGCGLEFDVVGVGGRYLGRFPDHILVPVKHDQRSG